MDKLIQDLRLVLLGAAAAVFASGVTLLFARVDAYYDYLDRIVQSDYSPYDSRVDGLWWVPACVWHVLLSVVASLLVHRYLKGRLRSPFLLWQVVGVVTLLGWALTASLLVSLNWVETRSLNSIDRIMDPASLRFLAKYFSTVFACNVVYGSVMHTASRQYVTAVR